MGQIVPVKTVVLKRERHHVFHHFCHKLICVQTAHHVVLKSNRRLTVLMLHQFNLVSLFQLHVTVKNSVIPDFSRQFFRKNVADIISPGSDTGQDIQLLPIVGNIGKIGGKFCFFGNGFSGNGVLIMYIYNKITAFILL